MTAATDPSRETDGSTVSAPENGTTTAQGFVSRARHLLRRHLGITILLGLGVALRLLFMIAYRPAFWFNGDSGRYISMSKAPLAPQLTRPLGYVVLLKALAPAGTHLAVVAVQHVLGLLLALAVYVLLQRRGLPRWLSCLAAAPLLFDSLVLSMEHYLLTDTLFTVLFAAAILVLLWSPKPGYVAAVSSGLLIVAAWFTKPTALPVALLIGLYLLVRRIGWRRVVAYAVAFTVPYLGIMAWIGDRPSVYGSQSSTAFYGRVAIIVDCDHIKLTPEERIACPDQPLGHRWDRADAFWWHRPARMDKWVYTPHGAQLLRDFTLQVLKQQPLDYLAIVGKESAAHFVPGLYLGPENECLRGRMVAPAQFRGSVPVPDRCPPAQASGAFRDGPTNPATAPTATPLTRALHAYSASMRMIPVMLSVGVLLTLVALFARRRVDGRIRLEAVLLILAGPGLTVLTVAVGMYEPRYALPALPMAVAAAALSWHGLATRSRGSAGQPRHDAGAADDAAGQAS